MAKIQLAYTQTFKPELLHNSMSPVWQFDKVAKDLCTVLRRHCEFVLFAELTVANVLHFHGILTLRDPVKFKRLTVKTLTQRFGYICLKPFNAYRTVGDWLRYCKKDVQQMSAILKDRPNPLDQDYKHKPISCLETGFDIESIWFQ